MTQNESTSPDTSRPEPAALPDPALKRLERLVGEWEITGRTLDSPEDNIRGRVAIKWLPGGFFLQQRGAMEMTGFTVESLEIVGYDPATDTFPSYVYSSLGGIPDLYHWDVQGDVVTHWTEGSTYTGTFSADGTTLSGGWRPEHDTAESAGNAYDAVMTRVG
jgi:hypothetical protein